MVIFSEVCAKNSVHGEGGAWYQGVPGSGDARPTTKREIEGGSGLGPHPRGKLIGIWSRSTPKGEVEGDLVQVNTQGES